MSYCRNDGMTSDVYVIRDNDDGLVCFCDARGIDGRYFHTQGDAEMIGHLAAHKEYGHKVPLHPITRLWGELEEASAS